MQRQQHDIEAFDRRQARVFILFVVLTGNRSKRPTVPLSLVYAVVMEFRGDRRRRW